MASPTQDYVGQAGNPKTQGLGRLVSQYAKSPALQTWLGGIYAMANDLELLFQRIGRAMSLDDDICYDPWSAGVYPVNTQKAKGAQLQIIGRVVGVTSVVPAEGTATSPQVLTDAQFALLIAAKIYRNSVKGGSIPQLIHAIQLVMPDLTSASLLTTWEIPNRMTVLVAVGRAVENWEAGIFAIPSGQNNLKGAVLPRPSGVTLQTFWQSAGCFGFSSSTAPGTPLLAGALGFNSDPASTTGHWARSF
jgi:hypothetical protein